MPQTVVGSQRACRSFVFLRSSRIVLEAVIYKMQYTHKVKIPLWATVLFVRVFWLDAVCSAAAAVCGGQQGQTETASSSANERQSSHEASRDVARFRELSTKPTGGTSNYQTNLLWCIQLISYRFSINTFRVCKSVETWDIFGSHIGQHFIWRSSLWCIVRKHS